MLYSVYVNVKFSAESRGNLVLNRAGVKFTQKLHGIFGDDFEFESGREPFGGLDYINFNSISDDDEGWIQSPWCHRLVRAASLQVVPRAAP